MAGARAIFTNLNQRPRVRAHVMAWEANAPLAVVLAVLIVVGAAFAPLYAVLVGTVIGAAARHQSVTGPLVAIGSVYAVSQVLGPARDAVTGMLNRRVDDRVRAQMMEAMLRPHGIAHLEDASLQDKLELARGIAWGITPGSTVGGLAQLWFSRLSSLGSLLLVARFRWWLAVVLLVANLVTLRSKRKAFINLTQIYGQGTERLRKSSYFREVALGADAAKEARVFGLGPWAIDRFDAAWFETMREVWAERRRGGLVVSAGLLLKGVVTVSAFLYIANAAFAAAARPPQDFVVIIQALLSVAGLSMVLGNPELILEQGTSAIRPTIEVERDIATHSASAIRGDRQDVTEPRDSIKFENVSFGYPGRDDLVFDGLNLELPAGHSLAIVGDNGAGKTTLVKLLARLYDPTSGRITVDGVPLADVDPSAWHRQLAAIFQDFGRYALTAAENVGLSNFGEEPDLDALNRVADRVGIRPLIDGWEHGWDSVLNRQFDKGVEASGGEWQRIALARALFAVERGAHVLVLDEPTAQLDVRGEAELYDRFLELTAGLTTVVISHRFSTVRRADRIVVVEHGKVCEVGSHDELMAAGGKYASMFELQAARFAS
ncbi:MAG: ATP-binding cassette, subfamily bacterial [Actinomycetota bacterium]|jgi:ATP-binding cassette subfamily B protein